MYSNIRMNMVQDELGFYPTLNRRVIPAWMAAEHYDYCEGRLLTRIRNFFRK